MRWKWKYPTGARNFSLHPQGALHHVQSYLSRQSAIAQPATAKAYSPIRNGKSFSFWLCSSIWMSSPSGDSPSRSTRRLRTSGASTFSQRSDDTPVSVVNNVLPGRVKMFFRATSYSCTVPVVAQDGKPLRDDQRHHWYRRFVALLGTFADKPVNTFRLPAFRAEHFPYSGPYPWLDLPDAEDRIAEKLRQGKLTEEEARQCRFWVANGYIVIGNLFEDAVLQSVWSAYEGAQVHTGKVVLPPEPGFRGRSVSWPISEIRTGRSARSCQILKHPRTSPLASRAHRAAAETAANHRRVQRLATGRSLRFDSHDHLSAGLSDSGLDRF